MAQKPVRRTFRIAVVVDRATIEFAPGMGVGVLASEEVTFTLPPEKFDSPLFAAALHEHQARLRNEVIRLTAEEVPPAPQKHEADSSS